MNALARLSRAGTRLPEPDGVLTTVAVMAALQALFDLPGLSETLLFTLSSLWSIAPYILLAVVSAGYLQAAGADALVAGAFRARMGLTVLAAALLGAVSPFCSCGVIPLIAGLLAMGVPLAPVMAFWLSSPIIDPPQFVMTASILGSGFAVGKTAAAFGLGLLGGFGVALFDRFGWFREPLKRRAACRCGTGCATPEEPRWAIWRDPSRRRRLVAGIGGQGLFLARWLALAFFLEGLMLAYLPAELAARLVGGEGWTAVLLATLVGVPAYLNGYAALPLVDGLVQQGMSAGAAMAFLLAGGVTSLPAAIAVHALARPAVFLLYLGLALSGSFIAGLLFGALAAPPGAI